MNRTYAARIAGAVLLAAGVAAAVSVPAGAAAVTGTIPTSADSQALPPDLLAAMHRDLGLSADQAQARFGQQERATGVERALRGSLAGSFGGAWFEPATGAFVVGVTDPAKADTVRAAGARPSVVSNSEAQLNSVKDALDRTEAPAAVNGWYVDVTNNSVVVTINRNLSAVTAAAAADTSAFLATARGKGAVRVVEENESPRPLYDVRGGDAYYIDSNARCSVGFSVQGGFVSAGHCGQSGASAAGFNRVAMGTFGGSVFPGNDYSWVRTNSNWTPRPSVKGPSGDVTVKGSQETAVGGAICRSGSTTGWHCGSVQGKNQTVRYSQGTVNGLTRTNVCAEPGDSGGSFISGSQAQGMTSGGSGDCTAGGTTYYQPVNPALQHFGLQLVTG